MFLLFLLLSCCNAFSSDSDSFEFDEEAVGLLKKKIAKRLIEQEVKEALREIFGEDWLQSSSGESSDYSESESEEVAVGSLDESSEEDWLSDSSEEMEGGVKYFHDDSDSEEVAVG